MEYGVAIRSDSAFLHPAEWEQWPSGKEKWRGEQNFAADQGAAAERPVARRSNDH
jgi:hypothetical protein